MSSGSLNEQYSDLVVRKEMKRKEKKRVALFIVTLMIPNDLHHIDGHVLL
jgi:hypothetical protein